MKCLFITILFYCSTLLSAQATLTIVIDNCENNDGCIALVLQDDKENEIQATKAEIKNQICTIVMFNLDNGKYVFKYFHDANKNDELDTNLIGMPKEGFGFSNNAKGTFGPPAHEETIFTLNSDTVMNCTPLYF